MFKEKLLGEFLDFWNGKSIKANQDGNYPVFGSNGVIGFSERFLYENKIILGRVGAYCGSVEYCTGKFWASDNTIVVSPKEQNSNVRYTYYLLKNLNLNHWAGGAAQPLLTQTVIKQVTANIPSNLTQNKIAAILSAYDDLIENNSRRIQILEEMARMIYQEWFVKFRFPGYEKTKLVESPLGMIPEGWGLKRLGDLIYVNNLSVAVKQPPKTINYIDIASVSLGKIERIEQIDFEQAPGRARRIVQHGDVIWSCVRPNRKSYALVLKPIENLIVSTGFAVLTPILIPCSYLYQAVTTDAFVGYLTNHATGAAYPAVNTEDFRNAEILLPDEKTLNLFHERTYPMLVLKQNFLKKNEVLKQTRDLLLPKLISGQIDVSDLDIPTER